MLDHFVNRHSELEMSRWLKEVCLPAKEHIYTHILKRFFNIRALGTQVHICDIFS